MATTQQPVRVLIVAVAETSGSALYGMFDVLKSAGSVWDSLVRAEEGAPLFQVDIVSPDGTPFTCGNGIPVTPDCAMTDDPPGDILILPELWLGPDDDFRGRHPALLEWIRRRHDGGTRIYSACSGAVMLAATGLLDGCEATSHWAYRDLFQQQYPQVHFNPAPSLVFADPEGRIVTAGGTTSWHDLAIHIIARHASPGEALKIAKVFLLKWHDEGQLPYASLVRNAPHTDAAVHRCQQWLAEHYRDAGAIPRVVAQSGIPERTLKRRFRAATGTTLIEYLQNLRVEEAKRQLESTHNPVDDIGVAVGYEDMSFFRRLFKRSTGLTPSQYRRMFQPVLEDADSSPLWRG
ncbi:MAG: helix-turn-helix domain-containing protein [Gammaproteobacteria bacterium]|nr:MAG: helix-turn-helix domain-containing protein [Gammaproteobacteria bacterium]